MRVLSGLVQGSAEWLAARTNYFTASEAPAMLSLSKYKTRDALLKEKATGITEFIDARTQSRFDSGHEAEALTRPKAEQIIGEELYPATGVNEVDGLQLLASFDGLTMDESINWENKLWNEAFAAQVAAGIVPDTHWPQIEQQMLVSGASKVLFTVSDGADKFVSTWYESIPERRAQVIAGWKQFKEDLAAYVPEAVTIQAVADVITDLPAVSVQITGAVQIASNLSLFETALRDFIDNKLVKKPETDQDFANLEAQIKAFKKAEDALDGVEASAMAQVAPIDEIKRLKDALKKLARDNRLMAEKILKERKDTIRAEHVQAGRDALQEHIAKLNTRIGKAYLSATCVQADFAGAIKSLRKLDSLKGAINDTLAAAKIEANEIADRIQLNLAYFDAAEADTAIAASVCPDLPSIITKACDDFTALIKSRIADYREREAAKAKADEQQKQRLEALATQAAVTAAAAAQVAQESTPTIKLSGNTVSVPMAVDTNADNDDVRRIINQQLDTMNRQELKQVLDHVRAIRARRAA